jgi:hypothetical protein
MLSYVFLVFALVHLALLAWGWSRWQRLRSHGLAMTLLPMTGLWYDCAVIGLGRFIGEGDLLLALNLPRYWIHAVLGPLWIIAAGCFLREAGLPWARKAWVMGAFCVLATCFALHDGLALFDLRLFPACFDDTVRYAQSVAANAVCRPDGAVIKAGGPPVAPIVTTLVIIAAGVAIGRRLRWWWMAAGGVFMLLMAALPASRFGPAFSNLGEIGITLGMLATATWLAGGAGRAAAPGPDRA